jgi:hypothetical protein
MAAGRVSCIPIGTGTAVAAMHGVACARTAVGAVHARSAAAARRASCSTGTCHTATASAAAVPTGPELTTGPRYALDTRCTIAAVGRGAPCATCPAVTTITVDTGRSARCRAGVAAGSALTSAVSVAARPAVTAAAVIHA